MTREEFDALKEGDVIRSAGGSGQGYVVTENYGKWKIAARTVTVTNPKEWERVAMRREMNEAQLKERAECEAMIQENGLGALRDAHEEHMRNINAWHDATGLLRETPPGHPLREAAEHNYSDAVRECANAAAIVSLEESKLGQVGSLTPEEER